MYLIIFSSHNCFVFIRYILEFCSVVDCLHYLQIIFTLLHNRLNILSKIHHSLCFFNSLQLLSLMSQLRIYWTPHLLKNTMQTTYLLCIYTAWSSVPIYLCHIRILRCVIISLCDFHWQNIQLHNSVNVNIGLIQLLKI